VRAHSAAWLVCAAVNGQAKVSKNEAAISFKENVLWLDIPVDNAQAVQLLQHAQQRDDHL
jgi:hypothetical protein